jgi:hypothetical protein
MRSSILLSVFCVAVAAVPLSDRRPSLPARDIPNYPGLRFGSNGKLSITVFSDLHFGERESYPVFISGTSLTDTHQPRAHPKTLRQLL